MNEPPELITNETIDLVEAYEDNALINSLSLFFTCVMVLMCLTGAIMNTLSLIIFTSSSFRRRSINILLAGLSASDLCLLILAIPVFSLSQLQKVIPGFSVQITGTILVYAYPITLMAQTMSVWMLVSITIDRYLAVCHPFAVRIHCTITRAIITIVSIVIFSIGYNIIRFWEYTINTGENVSEDMVILGLLRENHWYMVLYQNIATSVTQFVVPLFILCVLNLQVARTILEATETRRDLVASEKREHKTAKMLLFVVIVFIFCYTLSFCLNVLEFFNPELFKQPIGYLLNDINNILIVINSSSSFIFYCTYSSRYRSQIRTMYGLQWLTSRFCFITDRDGLQKSASNMDEYTAISTCSMRQKLCSRTSSPNGFSSIRMSTRQQFNGHNTLKPTLSTS
uniref:G-protein coupled receptors family 1 profile domain-containing protein n=1 Tax=Acrobeloides nanus TaxID=290746 RepID=A0A914CDK9_9BILA